MRQRSATNKLVFAPGEIEAAIASSINNSEAAEKLGISPFALQTHCREQGIALLPPGRRRSGEKRVRRDVVRELVLAGETIDQIRGRYSYGQWRTVNRHIAAVMEELERPRPWTPDEISEVHKLASLGVSQREIARRLHRNESSVRSLLKKGKAA